MLLRESEEVEQDGNIVLDYEYCVSKTVESQTAGLIQQAREHITGEI